MHSAGELDRAFAHFSQFFYTVCAPHSFFWRSQGLAQYDHRTRRCALASTNTLATSQSCPLQSSKGLCREVLTME